MMQICNGYEVGNLIHHLDSFHDYIIRIELIFIKDLKKICSCFNKYKGINCVQIQFTYFTWSTNNYIYI